MTAQGGRLFLQFSLTFQIFRECLPLGRPFCTIGLHLLVIEELRRIGRAVVEIIAVAIDDSAVLDLATAEYEIIEYLATDEADKGAA